MDLDPEHDFVGSHGACQLLGVGICRLRQYDHILMPYRIERGVRIYLRSRVEKLRDEREATRAARR